jgi:2-phosphosulfolactate phosphatase
MNIDVALEPCEISQLAIRDLSRTTCVVFDVLRATSSMVTGLVFGAEGIVPVSTIEEALEQKRLQQEALLGGERYGERIQGFDLGNSPFEYRQCQGRRIITTTTNGTVALRACAGAERVLIGAVLNLGAISKVLSQMAPENVLLVCAGTFETLALEDVWAAGRLLSDFEGADWSDSARVAHATSRLWPEPLAALAAARNGRALLAKGRQAEVEWCAQLSVYEVFGEMSHGVVRPVFLA